MAVNKRKILESARKYAQKGQKERALKEYEKLLKLDPRDAKLRLEIGDAYRRWGQVDDAVGTYTKVAEQYMAEGFDARAVAVYKQIQNLDPERWSTYEPLAELYQRMGLAGEAIATLQSAADGFHRTGDRRQALEVLRKMAAIDPSNTMSRMKVADLLHQEGMTEDAVAEYESVAEELERQGEGEQAASVLEKVLELTPDRNETLGKLARIHLERSDGQRAEPFAKRLVDNDPEEPDHYQLLAEAYRLQQREDQLAATYRKLADVYRQRGDEESAREIAQRFAPPADLVGPGAGAELEIDPLDTGDEPGDVSDFLADDDDDLGADLGPETLLEEELPPVTQAAPPPREPASEREPLAPSVDEGPVEAPDPNGDPEQLLAEACVYLRYGKRRQAVANLEAILVRDERHRGAWEKLGEAYAEGGDTEKAVDAWLRAAGYAQEDGDTASLDVLRDRIAALDQAAAATLGSPAQEPLVAEGGAPDEGYLDVSQPMLASVEAPETAVELDEIEIEVDEPQEPLAAPEIEVPAPEVEVAAPEIEVPAPEIEVPVPEVEVPEPEIDLSAEAPEPASPQASAGGGSASASASQQVAEELEEAEFYLQQGLLDEAESIYKRLLALAPNHPQVLVRLGELAAMRGDDPGETSGGKTAPTRAPERAAPSQPVSDDLTDWTDGGVEEAAGATPIAAPAAVAPSDVESAAAAPAPVAASPGDTPVQVEEGVPVVATAGDSASASELSKPTIDEIEPGDTGTLPPVSEEAARELEMPVANPGDSFDLAAELSEALDDGVSQSSATMSGGAGDSFAAVFREFKKGVSETLSESDHEAHYDLGIAYREMGLLDDAMAEFRIAMESRSRRLGCLHMLGQCALEIGQPDAAVGHLEKALASSELPPDAALAIRFDLGCAFEALDDVESARAAWQAVASVDPGFADVERRLAALEEAPKPEAAAPRPDDGSFESFSDLMDEARDEAETAAPSSPGMDFDDLVDEANAEPPAPAAAPPERTVAPEPPAPEPPPPAAPEPSPEDSKPERRKRKKISFV